ncbi:MAG: protein kinase [Candidatus Zixiibacteriota bacterium]|nr:MAG: protein kinase [candidate division Zixibacteria bacterium]
MLESGQQFAHFEIIRKLGEGGMGEVYLAEDSKLNRKVALKVLLEDAFDSPDRQERFRREATTAAQVSHPNVMSIYDISTARDPQSERELNYIVMEYIEGTSLFNYLRGRQPDMASVVRLAEKVASGLSAAHKMNIVHRDIKADNVIIDKDGVPKILDFGLAKPIEPAFSGDTEDKTRTVEKEELTKAGKILGTVSYMSPEQSRGEKIDTRSDIFSFGVLLYRMATGEFPFAGPTSVSTIAKILEARHEPPSLKNANVPPELERIIDKCLRKDPDDRYQDTRDLVVDLRNLRRLFDSGSSDTVSSELSSAAAARAAGSPRFGLKQLSLWLVAALVVFVAVMAYLDSSQPGRSSALKAQSNTLAILGFENKTGDPQWDWLETGLPEILLTDLAQAEAITIISRERIIDCFPEEKKTNHTFDECVEAASTLGAVNLLSGAFYKLGDQIRIDARLQEIATGNIIFGEKVVGDDPFTLVDSLTYKIASSLNLGKDMEDRKVATYTSSSPEAYRHYRVGVDKMYLELYDEAIEEFNQALAIDSTFALPYMRIGMCYIFQNMQQEGAKYFSMARRYEGKLPTRDRDLLEVYSDIWLDPEFDNAFIKLASFVKRYPDDKEGHAIYALLVNVFTGDTAKAFAHLDTALHIDPTYQLALSQYAAIYEKADLFEEAIEYSQLIKKYHPESPEPYMMLSRIYATQDRVDEAIGELGQLLTRFPDHQTARFRMSNLYVAKRDFDGAQREIEKLREVSGDDPYWLRAYYRQLADLSIWDGKFKRALRFSYQACQQAILTSDSNLIFHALTQLATYHHHYGNEDSAMFYLKQSHDWAPAFARIDYPLTAVVWDHTRAGELEPVLIETAEEMQRRLPPELWHVVDNIKRMFYAHGEADTTELISIYKDRMAAEKNVNVYDEGRALGIFQVLTGDFSEGKQNIEQSLQKFNVRVASHRYIRALYYLGIAEQGLGNDREAILLLEEVLRYWGEADVEIDITEDVRRRLAALTG